MTGDLGADSDKNDLGGASLEGYVKERVISGQKKHFQSQSNGSLRPRNGPGQLRLQFILGGKKTLNVRKANQHQPAQQAVQGWKGKHGKAGRAAIKFTSSSWMANVN